MDSPQTDHDNTFEAKLRAAWPFEKWRDLSVLVAVSGGADSVALLLALLTLQENGDHPTNIEVAHFNHGWRAEASNKDEAFVIDLCRQQKLTYHVGHSQRSEQTEEVARAERYNFLQTTAEQRGTRYLVTAHTADDQAETILHRIIRGTSLRGLRGIRPARKMSEAVTLVRPILGATRMEVVEYLKSRNQSHCIDESNEDRRYTRNRIRHELLPHLAQHYNPSIVDSLLRLGSLATDSTELIEEQIDPAYESCVISRDDKRVELDRSQLCVLPVFLQRELLARLWRQQGWPQKSMGFEQWNRLVESIQVGTTICMPGDVHLRNDQNVARLTRSDS